jgi:tungstate transport system ATP-binding protein
VGDWDELPGGEGGLSDGPAGLRSAQGAASSARTTPGTKGAARNAPASEDGGQGTASSAPTAVETRRAALVSVRDVRVRRRGETILDMAALDVWPGDVLAVVGPNGAGKSTLLQVMALLLAPEAGTVRFAGALAEARRNPVPVRRRLAMVFQEPLLFDTSVFDNVATGLRLRGVAREEVRERVGVWLDRLGIGHLAGRPARTLSGGEARRVSLARALVLEPELLLLDEPFGALDYPSRQALLADLPPLLAAARATTVLVTHDPTEAQALASRALALQAGRVVAAGAVADVLAAAGLAGPLAASPHARGAIAVPLSDG